MEGNKRRAGPQVKSPVRNVGKGGKKTPNGGRKGGGTGGKAGY